MRCRDMKQKSSSMVRSIVLVLPSGRPFQIEKYRRLSPSRSKTPGGDVCSLGDLPIELLVEIAELLGCDEFRNFRCTSTALLGACSMAVPRQWSVTAKTVLDSGYISMWFAGTINVTINCIQDIHELKRTGVTIKSVVLAFPCDNKTVSALGKIKTVEKVTVESKLITRLAALKGCTSMKTIILGNLTRDSAIKMLVSCTSIQTVVVRGHPKITNDTIAQLATLPNLTSINLYRTMKLTDKGVLALAQCNKLENANFTLCTQVTDVGAIAMSHHAKLKTLNLQHCHITPECCDMLRSHPYLKARVFHSYGDSWVADTADLWST